MNAKAAMLIHTWSVGKRYQLTLTVPFPVAGVVTVATCEWAPCLPQNLNQRERRDYLRGRAKALEILLKTGLFGAISLERPQQKTSETEKPCGLPGSSPLFNH